MKPPDKTIDSVRAYSRQLVRELGVLEPCPCLPSLSLTDGHTLIELSKKPGLSIRDLAKILVLDHSTVSRAVTKLVNKGLLKMKQGAQDARTRALELTKGGNKTLNEIHVSTNQRVHEALSCLNESEQATIINGLTLYAKALAKSRTQQDFIIRPIQKKDNSKVANIIRTVMPEYGATCVGFAIHDPEVDSMFQMYNNKKSFYLVVEHQGEVVGGAGIAPLKGGDKKTCELQKMYFLPVARGKGLGEKILCQLLDIARQKGFTRCYLETTSMMKEAHRLYEKCGFRPRKEPLGATGHFACDMWCEKELTV